MASRDPLPKSALNSIERSIRTLLPPPSVLAMYKDSLRATIDQLHFQMPDMDEISGIALAAGEYTRNLDRLTRELQPPELSQYFDEIAGTYSELGAAFLPHFAPSGEAVFSVLENAKQALHTQVTGANLELWDDILDMSGLGFQRNLEAIRAVPGIDVLYDEIQRSLGFGQSLAEEVRRTQSLAHSELVCLGDLASEVSQTLKDMSRIPGKLSAQAHSGRES